MNFSKKYLVGDKLLAKCGAAIRIEVLDRATGKLYDGELTGVHLEVRGAPNSYCPPNSTCWYLHHSKHVSSNSVGSSYG